VIENMKLSSLKKISQTDLNDLCVEIREFLIKSNSETGGHIGANLGTVEISVALHYCFNSPEDKIIWDTGHQGYTHKILTGRASKFKTLNTFGGMNRFISRSESEHDIIDASHAGTSLSLGLGLAITGKLNKSDNFVVSVIGDGSLCEGMALEALNHVSVEGELNFIIVLNDNGYAISKGFGALHNYLEKLKSGEDDLIFGSLGYEYIGPVDGHNLTALIRALEKAKKSKNIPFVHVVTEKGRGFTPAKDHVFQMHFSFPFDIETGETMPEYINPGYQDIAVDVIMEDMKTDLKTVVITPSTIYATGLQKCFDEFPERSFDPGMEEQHAMTLAAGFALGGYKPIIFYQTTFMQRAFDQLFHDICFMNLPVLILGIRSGFGGYDNPTHHGIYDLPYLKSIPNLKIMYPKDINELRRMMEFSISDLKQPTMILMPYGSQDDYSNIVDINIESIEEFQKAEIIVDEGQLLILTVGNKFRTALEVHDILKEIGINSGLVNIRYLKPLPQEQLLELFKRYKYVVTIEEYVLDGGMGSSVANLIMDHNIDVELLRIGIPNIFAEPGSNEELSNIYEIDSRHIIKMILNKYYKNDTNK